MKVINIFTAKWYQLVHEEENCLALLHFNFMFLGQFALKTNDVESSGFFLLLLKNKMDESVLCVSCKSYFGE